MKYAKMLGLLVLAAMALMAFANAASATELTKKTLNGTIDKMVPGELIHAQSEGTTTLDGSVNIACNKSTVEGEVTDAGGAGKTVKGKITKLTFEECGTATVTVLKPGTLEVHSIAGATGTDGTLTSSGTEITVLTHNFLGTVHCIYVTNNTDIGRLTSSRNTGKTATLDIGSAPIPEIPTDGLCGEDAEWTGNYEVTAPDYLDVD